LMLLTPRRRGTKAMLLRAFFVVWKGAHTASRLSKAGRANA
jgi:hypothetical protein